MPDVTASYGMSLTLLRFLGIFIHNSCLKCSIFIKLSQIVCLVNVHILIYHHANCDCSLWKVVLLSNAFFWYFFHILCTAYLKRYNYIKHSQTLYYGRSLEMKSKPM